MQVKNKIAVITGAASGIGAALARRFHAKAPRLLPLLTYRLMH